MINVKKLLYKLAKFKWFLTRPMTLGVRILLVQDEKVLLVKHTYQDAWYLPGGGVKKGETLVEAIRRECEEELGAQLKDVQLFGAYSNFYEYKNDHITIFLSTNFTINGNMDTEIEDYDFFSIHDLPTQTSPGSKKRIEEYVKGDYPKHGKW
jgi:8-oxo-dGTP pyrophosphatase MutT (NUDIX family)